MEAVSTTLLERFIAIFFAAGFGLLASRIAWKKGYYLLPPEVDLKGNITGLYVFAAFLIFLLCQIFSGYLILVLKIYWENGIFIQPSNYTLSSEVKGWANVLAFTVTFLALLLYFCSLKKSIREAVWGSPSEIRSVWQNIKDVLIGSMTWVLAYPWVIVISQLLGMIFAYFHTGPLPEQTVVQYLRDLYEHPWLFGITALFIVTIIPFIEELIFRGFLQSWLKSLFGRFKAIILTSLIFAFFHFSLSQGIENVELISALFLLSCYLGFVKERQQSLWASIGLHATFNFISTLLLLVVPIPLKN